MPENLTERISKLSPLKRALLKIEEMKSRLSAYEDGKKEAIAIVGMGCRFPGGVTNPETYWQLLANGVDAISEVPQDRWDVDAFYDSNPDVPGKMYTRFGGFLDDVDKFDTQFFRIMPKEASGMDPQQRLLLEVSWEALEQSGIAPQKLKGAKAGVFVGTCFDDYAKLRLSTTKDLEKIDAYNSLGSFWSMAAGRLSYFYGFHGPTVQLDTACSSSLMSVHLACQSLRSGECNLALAGGANLMLWPGTTIGFCKLKALAPDGRCKTFDATADGYARGEGAGIVVLKRLSDAVADNDNILALVKGSAANHDGPSSGLTVPSGHAQQELLRQALLNAGVDPLRISYVEAHGTGTLLGDPIELESLAAALCEGRPAEQPLVVGSVKTNFGHLEAAAGVAGLIKVVLALQNKTIPQHLHFEQPNPHFPWQESSIDVPTQSMEWPAGETPRLAGISSFGMSGTNAHVILQEAAPRADSSVQPPTARPYQLLALSGRTDEDLAELVDRYIAHLDVNPDLPLSDLCYTANTGRFHFRRRLAVAARTTAEVADGLRRLKGETLQRPGGKGKVAFLFSDVGSQYIGMGRELYATQAVFRTTLQRCAEILENHIDIPLLDFLNLNSEAQSIVGEGTLEKASVVQPALFAIEYALAEVWKSWGIVPDAALGVGLGEYVAACVSGVFNLEDGLKLAAHRGRLMDSSHDTSTEQAVEEMTEVAATVKFLAPQIALISSRTGEIAGGEIADVTYWGQSIGGSAPFATGMESLITQSCHLFVEIGPGQNLLGLGQQCLDEFLAQGKTKAPKSNFQWLASIQSDRSDWQQMLESLGVIYAQGLDVDWDAFFKDEAGRKIALPTYPFQRKRFWFQ